MKKLLISCLVLFCTIFCTYSVFAESSRSTYEIVADTQIVTQRGNICALLIMTDGTNDARVMLYDVAAVANIAVTNKLVEITVKGADNYGGRIWSYPVEFTNGLYADINGTGASFILEWIK